MLALSNRWAPILASQPETGMNYQISTVFLNNGRRFDNVLITGGYVTKVGNSTDIPFTDEDIVKIIVTHGK